MKLSLQQLTISLIIVSTVTYLICSAVFASHTINELKMIADQGCVYSQYNLGVIYYGGIGVLPDFKEAMSWFRKAADQNYADAQVAIAGMFYLGTGVPQDFNEAAKWARKAAHQNDAEAQYNLGMMYYGGRGVKQDFIEAVLWLKRAALQDYPNALFGLGSMYFEGLGTPRNYEESAKYFERAADQGCPDAQAILGAMYYEGLGVTLNYKTNKGRIEDVTNLIKAINAITKKHTSEELIELFNSITVPISKIKNVNEVVEDPLVARRILTSTDPKTGTKVILAPPPNMTPFLEQSGQQLSFPPRFGEQNQEIYGDILGYDEAALAEFKEKGII